MKALPRTAIALGFAWLQLSCNPIPDDIETNAEDITFCCDDTQGPPGKIGEFDIFLNEGALGFLDPASIEAQLTYMGIEGTPIRLSLPNGAALPLGTTTVEVFADACDFEQVNIRYRVMLVGRRADESRNSFTSSSIVDFSVTNTCPPGAGTGGTGGSGPGGTGGAGPGGTGGSGPGGTGGSGPGGPCNEVDVPDVPQLTGAPTTGSASIGAGDQVTVFIPVDGDTEEVRVLLAFSEDPVFIAGEATVATNGNETVSLVIDSFDVAEAGRLLPGDRAPKGR